MRLVATEYLSLDGVFEEPGRWSGPFFDDEAAQFKWQELQASDALLLGRKTYDGFAAAWPAMKDEAGFADRMNSMPKYVVSATAEKLEWQGSQLLRGHLAEEVRKLKAEPGQDILLSGSAQLFNALGQENLIDLYRLMLHPIVLGEGQRLFAADVDRRALELTHTRTFRSGIVILEYRPASRS
ncbi:MAG: dihydrofolate reductase family protein [Candidatus Dormibacter sp.]|uniref:dihydrofolate reductase family protein n=1 Tax=Candidatus Dormibacter sp. TaxID=2973982 RepID=UPI000DB0B2E7|nr:MAG: pyrimidine reductase [Candidatus Dormibacteraeota bacterium]